MQFSHTFRIIRIYAESLSRRYPTTPSPSATTSSTTARPSTPSATPASSPPGTAATSPPTCSTHPPGKRVGPSRAGPGRAGYGCQFDAAGFVAAWGGRSTCSTRPPGNAISTGRPGRSGRVGPGRVGVRVGCSCGASARRDHRDRCPSRPLPSTAASAHLALLAGRAGPAGRVGGCWV